MLLHRDSASLRAFIIGPHGMSDNVDRYESVVFMVNGFGIAAAIPYLKKPSLHSPVK
jgi:hypothetical protein